jgi:hypothetical protein
VSGTSLYGSAKHIDLDAGNERLQEMMGIMAQERGGQVFATDER